MDQVDREERADRVLVIADDPLARTGLSHMLAAREAEALPLLVVVAQLSAEDDLGAAVRAHHPSAVLWDLGVDARKVADRLSELERVPAPTVLLLPDDTLAVDAIAQGARGVLFRDADAPAIASALRAVARGLVALHPSIVANVVPTRDRLSPLIDELTARESEVLDLLTAGLANKVIAQRLGISEHTVKFHVNAILGKLGAESRTDAVVRAARMGLVIL